MVMHRWAAIGMVAIFIGIAGCEWIAGIETGTVGYCTENPSGVTNPIEDDGNPCTTDKCVGSATDHIVVSDGTRCALGKNVGTCNSGQCKLDCVNNPSTCQCTVDTECPLAEDCAIWTCNAGKCLRSAANENAPIANQTAGDCQQMVCQGGMTQSVPDDQDTPATNGCVITACNGGMPMMVNAQVGTTCPMGACNGTGECVDCLSVADWSTCGMQCPVQKCNGEVSGDGTTCKSGFASDGVCCENACTDECKSCNVMGMAGTCTNIAYYQPDPSYVPTGGGNTASCDPATTGAVCNGSGKCLKISGTTCLTGSQCISATCGAMMKCLGATGESCFIGTDCVSGMCMVGACK